jgi:hypothetical protein
MSTVFCSKNFSCKRKLSVRECLARAEAQGMADDDFSSLIRLLDT